MQPAAVAHRPWPLPRQPWILVMHWHDLLFMHWPIDSAAIRRHIPAALTIDTFDGMAWIGVVPFRMQGVRPRLVPALPGLSAFPELNLRTYVSVEGKPGVWFFSLDAGNPLAVEAARDVFHLNYYDARMTCEQDGERVSYSSVRTHRGAPPAVFQGQYQPTGPVYRSTPGTLEHWLTERYCLYAANRRGVVWRGDIHHSPWPLQPAEAAIERNTMAEQIGVALPDTKPLLHFARSLAVMAWWPQRVRV
ncbi:MAG: YqjF family protein [Roseiflexaceae bacterium]